MSEDTTLTYEFAYQLSPDLSEEEAVAEVKGLTDFIEQQEGKIVERLEPRRKHLSYPIEHKHYAYFGYVHFSAPAEALAVLQAHLKLQTNVMRQMVIKLPDHKEVRTLGDVQERRPPVVEAPKAATPATPKPAPTPEQEKQMSQDIEEVLEQL